MAHYFQIMYLKRGAKNFRRDDYHLYNNIEKAKEQVGYFLDGSDVVRAGLTMWTTCGDILSLDKNVYFVTKEKDGTHTVSFDITETITD